MKDDKSYPNIQITNAPFPQVLLTRKIIDIMLPAKNPNTNNPSQTGRGASPGAKTSIQCFRRTKDIQPKRIRGRGSHRGLVGDSRTGEIGPI